MAYTVKKLAKLSGVSIRTLRFYDEIALLKPAYYGDNKYRYYEEDQLLMLQQILFFRELGFSLTDIKRIVNSDDFDKIESLNSHRLILEHSLDRTKTLIKTIDKTILYLRGETRMRNEELFVGFDPEKQKEYETYLINRLGEEKIKDSLDASKIKMKDWTEEDWNKFHQEWDLICKGLANLLGKKLKANSPEVQELIRRHYQWLPWHDTCTKEAYIGLGQGYTEFEWKKAFSQYDPRHPHLAKFMAEAMREFAEKELA